MIKISIKISISLLFHLYKLCTRSLTHRVNTILDFNQPREQATFFRKTDFEQPTTYLQFMSQFLQKPSEYRQPLYSSFIDYQTAFVNIEIPAVLEAFIDQGIHQTYIQIIKKIYSQETLSVRLHTKSVKIDIERGIRQGRFNIPQTL